MDYIFMCYCKLTGPGENLAKGPGTDKLRHLFLTVIFVLFHIT